MLIKPILPLLKSKKDYAGMSYLGTVEANNDPEKLARIKVRISLYSDLATDDLPWASPLLGSCGNSTFNGGFNIPEVGSQVRITFPSRDVTAPYYSGAELTQQNRVTLFDDNYPNSYGYKDSNGNFIKVDKTAGTTHWQHESTTNAQVSADGTITVSLRGGLTLTLTSSNTFNLDSGPIEIEGLADGSLNIKTESELYMQALKTRINSDNVEIAGNLSVGAGASCTMWCLNGFAVFKDGILTKFVGYG